MLVTSHKGGSNSCLLKSGKWVNFIISSYILGGSGTSVWGYLTAGVVAANVAANLVNNANENNNNNNNNNNQDNTNNNNMNIGNSANNNANMNMLLPGRAFQSTNTSSIKPVGLVLETLQPTSDPVLPEPAVSPASRAPGCGRLQSCD